MTLPADVLDLRDWKLTLPVGSKNSPIEIKQPSLATYDGDWFKAVDGPGVAFRAPVNGVTTSGSGFPRSELREMAPGGDWSSTDGKTHTMVIDEAVTRIPNPRTSGNSAVVGGQIHDPTHDISVFRIEDGKVYVTNGDDSHYAVADPAYVRGTRFRAMYVVADGSVTAYYNGRKVCSFEADFSSAYFKAGAYVQANASNSSPGDETNYGENILYSVTVAHGAPLPGTDPAAPPVPDPTPVPPVTTTSGPIVAVIRHGNKPAGSVTGFGPPNGTGAEDSHSLTKDGWARAAGLVPLFSAPRPDLFVPTRIYAADGASAGERMKQTVTALAAELGLTPILRFDKSQEAELAAELKTLPASERALVCWEHSEAPKIWAGMGAVSPTPPTSWPDENYNSIEVFTGDGHGSWAWTETAELILPADKPVGLGGRAVPVGTMPAPPVVTPPAVDPPAVVPPVTDPPPVEPPVDAPPVTEPPVDVPPADPTPEPMPAPAPATKSWWQRLKAWWRKVMDIINELFRGM